MPALILGCTVLFPPALFSQDFIDHALPSFPIQTIRVEYYCPVKLRATPGYERIRGRFIGPRIKLLEGSFLHLGVGEENVDEMVFGWLTSPRGYQLLGGLASGRFDAEQIAANAGQSRITATVVGDWTAYCVGEEDSCLVVLDETLAAFGPADFLSAMRDTRGGQTPSLLSNSQFVNLLGQIRSQPPLWGIALREAVPEWFGAWLVGPQGASIDWGSLLNYAEALSFYADINGKVEFHLNLDFSNSEAATRLLRTLETLRQLQQAAWQSQAPGRPNPLDAVKLSGGDRRISLTAITDYATLQAGDPFSGAY